MNSTLLIFCLLLGLINLTLIIFLIREQGSVKEFIADQLDYTENNIKTRMNGITKVFGDMYAVIKKSIDGKS